MLIDRCIPLPPRHSAQWAPVSRVAIRAVVLLAGFLPVTVCAQTNLTITGIVCDQLTGLPLEQTQITVDALGLSAVTDAAGRFTLRTVPPGVWQIRVERMGYKTATLSNIQTHEGFEPSLAIRLTPAPLPLAGHTTIHTARPARPASAIHRLTKSDIARRGHRELAQALEEIPGVIVHGSPETPGGTRVSIGGASPERVSVLLDGLPLSGGVDNAVSLDAIPLSSVSAIEVTPGSQSAHAGDAAMGGVVNIITESAAESGRHTLRLDAGSFETRDAEMGGGEVIAGSDIRWALARHVQKDPFQYPDADTTATRQGTRTDDWRIYSALSPGNTRRVRMSVFHYDAAVGQPGALQQSSPGARNETRRTRLQFRWDPRPEGAIPSVAGWYESSREHYTSPVLYRNDTEMGERFYGLRTGTQWFIHAIRIQPEAEVRARRMEGKDHLRPHLSFGMHHRTEWSLRQTVTGERRLRGNSLSASLGAAIDGDQRTRPIYSPRLDVSWAAPAAVSLRAGWGKSFRRPPLTSLFWKADAFAIGNPLLKPERSHDWDIGLNIRLGPIYADSRYFQRDIEGMIVWQRATATGQYTPLNLDRVSAEGREDHLRLTLLNNNLNLHYTHVLNATHDRSGEVNYDGDVVPLIPRHTHHLRADAAIGPFGAGLSARWVGERHLRRDNDPGRTLRPYRVVDARLRMGILRHAPELGIALRVENLTNERYDLLERYPAPGRFWAVELSLKLSSGGAP